jgi:enoyl-CoA hydratase
MPSITTSMQGHLAVITIDSDRGQNTLDAALRDGFATACAAAADDEEVRVVLITGVSGVFAQGLEPMPTALEPAGAASVVASLNKPTVAWIDGVCVDMGLELALACDVRFASATSTFAMTATQAGQLPWDGGTQRLTRAVGRGQALRMLLTGESIDADEALRIGLVQGVGEEEMVATWAARATAGAPIASAYTKEAANSAGDLTLDQGMRLEADLSVLLQSTADRAEGLEAYTAKRKRTFEGR